MENDMTLVKLVALWQSLKPRRVALGMTQPEMAEALDLGLSTYTHYETAAINLKMDTLLRMDGKITMLEKAGGKPVDNSVGNLGKNYRLARIQSVLPKEFTGASTGKVSDKHMTNKA